MISLDTDRPIRGAFRLIRSLSVPELECLRNAINKRLCATSRENDDQVCIGSSLADLDSWDNLSDASKEYLERYFSGLSPRPHTSEVPHVHAAVSSQ